MATKIKRLKTALKKANQRVNKAFARYKEALLPLYMKREGDFVSVYSRCVKSNGWLEFATDFSRTFYRRGRGGEFYEKLQVNLAWDNYRRVCRVVGQDYLDLRKLEKAIEVAVNKLGKILRQLEKLGVNPYAEKDLWQ